MSGAGCATGAAATTAAPADASAAVVAAAEEAVAFYAVRRSNSFGRSLARIVATANCFSTYVCVCAIARLGV